MLGGIGAIGIAAVAVPEAKAQPAVLRFGLAMPLTGSQATCGQDQVKAAQWAIDEINKAGGTVVAYEAYDPKATDWTGTLLKVRIASPDIIHIQRLVADTPQVIAQLRQLGMSQPVSSYSAVYNPKLIQQLGSAANGVIATSLAPGVNDRPAVKAYVERWK